MSNFSPYANYGYFALAKEATPGVAVVPTNFLRILSESLEVNYGTSLVQEIAGTRERNVRSVSNKIELGGDIEFYVEPKQIGHIFRGLFGAPTVQTLSAGVAYRHVFTVTDTPQTYTLDIAPGAAPWTHRYTGVQISAIKIEQDDNKIKCTITVMPRKAFIVARVTTAVSSGTALAVDQNAGLTTSDSILILSKADGYTTKATLTISDVGTDGISLTTSTIGVSLAVDDLVVIKRAATATYDQGPVFTWLGGSQVSIGADIDNTTAVDKENFSLEYMNEVEPRWFAGVEESSRYSGDVIVKGYSGKGELHRFYDAQSNIDKMRKNEKFGARILMQGETPLSVNSAVAAYSVWGSGNGFRVTAETAGKAGNDISVTLVIASDDNLAVTKSGNNVIVYLANTTASKNTGTLIAAAIDALTGVAGAAEGTGAQQFTTAIASQNLGFYPGQTNVVGRDASEKPYIQFDNAAVKIDPTFPGGSEDDILMEELPLTFFMDVETPVNPKGWSTRIFLVNSVATYN